MMIPSTACFIQERIGARRCAAFDVSAVCSGFVYALTVANDMMRGNPRYQNVLVVAAETYSKIMDWSDRTTCVFFGDGAGAAVLQRVDGAGGILGSYLMADGGGWDAIMFAGGGSRHPTSAETLERNMHVFRMDGRRVWDFVMEAFPDAVYGALNDASLQLTDIDWIIPHQANAAMIRTCIDKLGFPMEKVVFNLDKYGNTAGASIAIALDEAVKQERIKRGDKVLLVSFGGGLAWGSMVLSWWA